MMKIESHFEALIFYGVDKITNLEPSENIIVSEKSLCSSLIHVMKESTNEYYNMRLTLGSEIT